MIAPQLFRKITTEGRPTLVLAAPITLAVSAGLLAELRAAYKPGEEIGGILRAVPDVSGRRLVVAAWTQLPNVLPTGQRSRSYAPDANAQRSAMQSAINSGALPIRLHSHPATTGESAYDVQGLNFFQKTSVADRHNSFLPLSINGQFVVMPDALLSPNNRAGSDIRLKIYNGFIAPLSLRGLLNGERVYLYLVALAFAGFIIAGRFSRNTWIWAGLLAIVVFGNEERKRPRYTMEPNGNLSITIPYY